MVFVVAPSLLLLSALCLSSSDRSIGVNGLSLPRPSHVCTRRIGNKNCRDSKLWMTSSSASDVIDSNDEGDADLPKLKKKLTREFFSIGFPAFIQLAAEPLAALVVRHSFVRIWLRSSSCKISRSSSSVCDIFAHFSNRILLISVCSLY